MKKNMGTIDRALRFFVIGPLAVWGATEASAGVSILLYAVAGIMFVTAVAGFCPLYALLHINTLPRRTSLGA